MITNKNLGIKDKEINESKVSEEFVKIKKIFEIKLKIICILKNKLDNNKTQ